MCWPGWTNMQLRRKARVGVFADASYFLVYRQVATDLVLYSVHVVLYFAVVHHVCGFPERSRALDLPLFAPLEAVPSWLRVPALLVPSTSGIAGFLRLTEMGAALRHVLAEWLALWALAAGCFLLAWLAERRAPSAHPPSH